MLLIRKQGASAPKELGLFWQMQTSDGMTVDVYIYVSTLQLFDGDPVGPVGLLKRHRLSLERIASEKYDREGVSAANLLHITQEDLRTAQVSEAKTDDAE